MLFLFKGFIVGFEFAAPVLAISLLCMQYTLDGGIRLGILAGLGAATADMMYGMLVALELHPVQSFLLSVHVPLTFFGGLWICYLGIKKFYKKPKIKKIKLTGKSFLCAYVTTFFLTLTNPETIVDFTRIFSDADIYLIGNAQLQSLGFVVSVFIGSAVWWLSLSFIIDKLRHKISLQVLQYINYVAGTLILIFGMYSIVELWV
jgi:threonine/homoserine/homoserine lactone efflux protein